MSPHPPGWLGITLSTDFLGYSGWSVPSFATSGCCPWADRRRHWQPLANLTAAYGNRNISITSSSARVCWVPGALQDLLLPRCSPWGRGVMADWSEQMHLPRALRQGLIRRSDRPSWPIAWPSPFFGGGSCLHVKGGL